MCIELFVNHALLFISNCTVANMTNVSNVSNVSQTIDMTHVYDMFTTVAPFITETTSAPMNTTYNTSTDTTDMGGMTSTNNPIHDYHLYLAIISPSIALALIWCATAYARANCTPCKPKNTTEKKKETKKNKEPCCTCCKPKKVKPTRKKECISPV